LILIAHHPHPRVGFFQGVLHRQRVDHRGEHAHMVAGDAIHPAGRESRASEDVAAADHQPDFRAGLLHLDHLARDAGDDFRIDAVILAPHQRLAGELEQDAAVFQR
jgi:hypothetical protein